MKESYNHLNYTSSNEIERVFSSRALYAHSGSIGRAGEMARK